MKTIAPVAALLGIVVATAPRAVESQGARFELVQQDLFSSGGTFVNAWADYDSDGDVDLFVGFDGAPNRLYRNQDARFQDAAAEAGVADARPTRAAAWGDADADGDADLLVGFVPAKAGEPASSSPSVLRFYRNTKGVFRDETESVGLRVDAGAVRQPVWVDYDGDGDLDLYVNGTVTGGKQHPDYLFRNTGTKFEDVTPAEIGSPNSDHGAQWADFDRDGDMDLALTGVQKDGMHWLLRNTLAPAQSSRVLNVRILDSNGRSTLAGTEVAFWFGSGSALTNRQTRLIDGGSGYNSQDDVPVHVVMPEANAQMSLRIRRPGGGVHNVDTKIDAARWRNRVYEYKLPAVRRTP